MSNLGEFEDLSYPKRKPWLVGVILLAVAVLLVVYRVLPRPEKKESAESVAPAVEQPVETPRPVVSPVPPVTNVAAVIPTNTRAATPRPPQAPVSRMPVAVQPAPVQPITVEDGRKLLELARALEGKGDLAGARKAYMDFLRGNSDPNARQAAEGRLGEINMKLLFSPSPMPEKIVHVVAPGDSADKIAKKYGMTRELVIRGNGLPESGLMRAGDELKLFNGKFSIVVGKTKCELVLLMNGEFCKRYMAGLGTYGKTPTGDFVVTLKQEKPTWYKRDGESYPFGSKENILGTRWMAIKDTANPKGDKRGLGMHGTWDDSSIGKSLSGGCIRLYNKDVEELYELLPLGTPVRISD